MWANHSICIPEELSLGSSYVAVILWSHEETCLKGRTTQSPLYGSEGLLRTSDCRVINEPGEAAVLRLQL